VEVTRLRQGAYRLFGALFLYPDETRLARWAVAAGALAQESESLAVFPFYHPWQRLLTALQGLTEGDLANLQETYVGLFRIQRDGTLCLPYESFHRDPYGQAAGWVTAQLEREYAAAGLALAPSLQDLPDHVAVELEFMAFLCAREAQAWEEEALPAGFQALKEQQAFLEEHLGFWFPAFARQVMTTDPQGLYAVAAEAAHAFIHHDRDWVALLVERMGSQVSSS
jgi:TorA maturation chaperone TorD